MEGADFSIQTFFEIRWADAKIILNERDRSFVHTTEAYKSLERTLLLPSRPRPDKPFSDEWKAMIGATVDVSMALRDLERCGELVGSCNPSDGSLVSGDLL